jgi:hypothetical protein
MAEPENIIVTEEPIQIILGENAQGTHTIVTIPEPTHLISEEPGETHILTIGEQGPPGPPGEKGETGSAGEKGEKGDRGEKGEDAFYLHRQDAPAAEWVVRHGLNKFPSVTVVDSAGSQVYGDCVYVNTDTIRLVFSAPFSGVAYFN